MGTFRVRKAIPIIPGLLRLNASGSASRGRGAKGGVSWTFHLGRLVSYNTRDGRWSINPPGPGSWQSGTRRQRQAKRAQKREARDARRQADRERWTAHFADRSAGAVVAVRRTDTAPDRSEADHGPGAVRAGPDGWQRPSGYEPRHDEYSEPVRSGHMSMIAAERRRHLGVAEAERIEAEEREARRTGRRPLPADTAGNGYGMPFADRQQHLRSAGLCGARTQKDGTPCLNHARTCPHH